MSVSNGGQYKRGDEVLTAEDGLSALKLLNQHRPDVIFVDQVMPNITGDKLCRIIRNRPELEDVCIIMLSAIAAETDLRFTEFGANYCIAKGPFDKMSTHILALLYKLDAEGRCGHSERVIGKEDLFYRQISEELLYSKNHAEAILNHLAEGIVEITTEGEIIYVNPQASLMTGVAEVELLGTSFYDLFEEKDRQQISETLASVQAGAPEGGSTFSLRCNNRLVCFEVGSVHGKEARILTIVLTGIARPKPTGHDPDSTIRRSQSSGQEPGILQQSVSGMISDAERLLDCIENESANESALRELSEKLRNSIDRIRNSSGQWETPDVT